MLACQRGAAPTMPFDWGAIATALGARGGCASCVIMHGGIAARKREQVPFTPLLLASWVADVWSLDCVLCYRLSDATRTLVVAITNMTMLLTHCSRSPGSVDFHRRKLSHPEPGT